MKDRVTEEGERTPYVQFLANGELWVKGHSFPEDAGSFYDPLLRWMERYKEAPPSRTVLTIDLESFNIGSSKYLLYLIYHLQDIVRSGYEVQVEWVHDEGDEEMLEAGEDYEVMAGFPFRFRFRSTQRDLARKASLARS
jgi:hypothetical protein